MTTPNQKRLGDETIPTELKQLSTWLTWRSVQKPGEPKPRKVPYYTNGRKRQGTQGEPADRKALSTFDAAAAAAQQQGAAGVGLAMLADNGLVGLDFDHCIPELSGIIDERVLPLIAGTYAEISPSGTGIRAFYRGELADGRENKDPVELDLQVFCAKGYLTVTGNKLPDALLTIAPLTDTVRDYWTRRRGRTATSAKSAEPAAPFIPEPHACTLGDVKEMLTYVEAHRDDRELWTHVLWSVERAKLGAQDGSNPKDWDTSVVEWSSPSLKFVSAEDVLNKMREAQTRAGFGIHQLEKIAREGGWIPTDEQEERLGNRSKVEDFPRATAEQDAALQNYLPSTATFDFKPVPLSAFAEGPEPEWIIDGLIPRAQMMVIFGAPGTGKSFFALDLAASIARGIPWRDHETKQGRALYICGESPGGFRQRWKAYANAHSITLADLDSHLFMLTNMPNLLEVTQVGAFIAQIKAVGEFDFIVIDTLARAMPGGNENTSDGMGLAIKHAHQIHKSTDAMICLVHHSGKDEARGSRGWSGLLGQIDAELEITRTNNREIREATNTKQRDGEDGQKFQFALDQVAAGTDSKGRIRTSLVVRPVEVAAETFTKLRLPTSINQRAVWNVLDEAQREMSADELITAAVGHLAYDPAKGRDRRREGIRCAIDRMHADGVLTVSGNLYGLHRPAEFPDATAQSKPAAMVDMPMRSKEEAA
jgi:AAA domain